jgi:hypothetical protein
VYSALSSSPRNIPLRVLNELMGETDRTIDGEVIKEDASD